MKVETPIASSVDGRAAVEPNGSVLDAARFRAAFELHADVVLRYASSRVGPQAAEEVASETFAVAWRIRDKVTDSSDGSVLAWLLGVATIVIARHRKSERRWLQMGADAARLVPDLRLEDETSRADERADAGRHAQELGQALSRIPHRERDPLLLHVVAGLSYDEIAHSLGIPIGTVRSRISRGRSRLVAHMEAGA